MALGASLLFAGQSITAAPSYAGDGPPAAVATVVGGGSSSAGGWIVGGLFISVASIIACAMIVGAEEGREMTLEEALLSGAIPLGCLLREEFGLDLTP
ncbi:MAG: hypothetical protein RIC24_00330 [Hyphomicrobiales bacterium]